MKAAHQLAFVCGSLAFSSLASAGPRYQFEAPSSEVPRKFAAQLRAQQWQETVDPPDLVVGMASQPDGAKECWTLSLRWWDGKVSTNSSCAPKHIGYIETAPPSPAELDRLVLQPALKFALQSAASRRQLRLLNRGKDDVAVKVGDAQAPLAFGPSGAVAWLSSDPATINSGRCRLAVDSAMTDVDVLALTATRTLRVTFTMDSDAVKEIKTQKDTPFELALDASASGTEITLPCSGKPTAVLEAKPNEYTATPKLGGRPPPLLGAWTVKTKGDDGILTCRLRAENAVEDSATSLSINFSIPWWQRFYTKLLALLGGLGVLVAAISTVVEPVRKLFRKSA